MNGSIYYIKNQVNGKGYVGKTLNSIQNRFQEHVADSQKTRCEKRPLYDAMNKYGVENFTIELLETAPYDKLSEREQYWIAQKDTYKNGYNATRGGDGKVLYDYEAIIQKFRDGMLVKEIAEYFECCVDTVSAILTLAGEKPVSNFQKSKNKAVKCIDKNGTETIFESRSDAAKWLVENHYTTSTKINGMATHINEVVTGKRKSYLGFKWENI